MEVAPGPDYVLTLIHGTFANNAPWANSPQSLFRQELEAKLAPASVAFEPFNWSGRNTHNARYRGSLALRRALRDQARRFPHSQRVLVTHSHGGNVAAYALRDTATARRVSGVVTLGTPFIECTPRDIVTVARAWLVVLITALLYVAALLYIVFLSYLPGWTVWGFLAAVVILSRGLSSAYLPSIIGPRWWGRSQKRLVRRFAPGNAISIPFLCGVVARDEARLALRALAGVSQFVGSRRGKDPRFGSIAGVLIALLGSGYVLITLAQGDKLNENLALWLWVGLASLFTWIFVITRANPIRQGVYATLTQWVGYGGGGKISWLFTVRQSLVPPGVANSTQEHFRPSGGFFGWAGLQHSWLYKSPEVIGRIASWIRQHVPHSIDGSRDSVTRSRSRG
jgi:hypothetical protein